MQLMEFGEYLKLLLKEKGISASELARMMAYKSRNTIFRILDGEGGHASRQAFFERLTLEDPLSLSEEEHSMLAEALEVSRVGAGVYLDNQAMAELISGLNEKSSASVQIAGYSDSQETMTLRQLLDTYVCAKELKLEICGCCSKVIFSALSDVLVDGKHNCDVSVVHYVYMGAEEIIANIAAIQPMLYAQCYTAYSIRPNVYSPERERIYRSNCICAHVTLEDGNAYDDVLILSDADRMIRYGRRRRGGFELADLFFEDEHLKDYPIKSEFTLNSAKQELINYIDEYRRIEHNHAVYTVKLDVPFSFIHPNLLVDAAKEGFRKAGFAPEGEMENLIAGLYDIQLQRFQNCFGKRKPSHTVFSRKAMEDFARTGRQSDHFFAMRPYTKEERVHILSQIRDQARDNPNFFIYFFRDDVVPPQMEIALYEGVGVLLSKPFTHYDLGGDHAEAIIAQNDFCQRYKMYFCEDLLERQVITQEETLDILDRLIEIAKEE